MCVGEAPRRANSGRWARGPRRRPARRARGSGASLKHMAAIRERLEGVEGQRHVEGQVRAWGAFLPVGIRLDGARRPAGYQIVDVRTPVPGQVEDVVPGFEVDLLEVRHHAEVRGGERGDGGEGGGGLRDVSGRGRPGGCRYPWTSATRSPLRRRRDPGRFRGSNPTTPSTGTSGRRSTARARGRRRRARASARRPRLEDRQVDPREVLAEPRAPDHVRHLERLDRPRAAAARPARRPPGHALDAGRGEILRLRPGPAASPVASSFGRALRPIGVPIVSTRWKTNRKNGNSEPRRDALPCETGCGPTSCPTASVACVARQLDGDLRPRVAGADERTSPVLQLDGLAVVARMQLHDARVELARERGHPGARCAPSPPPRCPPRTAGRPARRRSGRPRRESRST